MRDEVIYLILFALIIFVFFVIKSMKKDQLNLIDEILGDAEYVSSKIKILYSITSNEDYSNYEFVQFVKRKNLKIYMIPSFVSPLSSAGIYLLNSFSKDDSLLQFVVEEFKYGQDKTKFKIDSHDIIPNTETYYLYISKTEFDLINSWFHGTEYPVSN